MKKAVSYLLAFMGLATACGQQSYEDVEVQQFSELAAGQGAIVLDVRTEKEYKEGHLEGSINIDQSQKDFIDRAKTELQAGKTIAVYCRSGRRSASAAGRLSAEGYKCVNLKGGIVAWKEAGKKVVVDKYETDVFRTKSGKVVKMHALMHGSIRIEYDGREIEVDPVSKLGDRTVDYGEMPKADFIFVTHEHGDHYDEAALRTLTKEGTQIVMNKRCAEMYGAGKAMENGDKEQIADDISVEAVAAYNTTEGHLQYHPKGRDNGYIVSLDGFRVYIAGDTEDIEEMGTVGDIDVAFMPCNQPYTMTVEQLVKAAKTVKPKVLFPYHYGRTDVSSIPTELDGEGIDVRIRHYE